LELIGNNRANKETTRAASCALFKSNIFMPKPC
jgi:hypothetical protein